MESFKRQADRLLYEFGLLQELEKFGRPHIIGSYLMDTMACNDLDIDVSSEGMDMQQLYRLTGVLLDHFSPVWYEAKQEISEKGKPVWFHGFETMATGERWNIDIWFFDEETICKAEAFCRQVKQQLDNDDEKRQAVIGIKRELIARGLYAFDWFTSMDVYRAVLERGVRSTEEFLLRCKK